MIIKKYNVQVERCGTQRLDANATIVSSIPIDFNFKDENVVIAMSAGDASRQGINYYSTYIHTYVFWSTNYASLR